VRGRAVLPIARCLAGGVRAYAGPYPDRFNVKVITDDERRVSSLRARLTEAGFRGVEVEEAGDPTETLLGFHVAWGAARLEPAVAEHIKDAMATEMLALGATVAFRPTYSDLEDTDVTVRITFPTLGIADGSLLGRATAPGRFNLRIHCPNLSSVDFIVADFAPWGFARCDSAVGSEPNPMIKFGGAPVELVDRV
jgi:hypothetical protein